ncbi:MAG: hypothetical protein M3068_14375 [Gemmatimonadota bacterium]|nr:hypothetical protein [Gemmatimonadota bacterium]MDQ6888456.1 hypothetical protein [Gemmatimonadota bacterium]
MRALSLALGAALLLGVLAPSRAEGQRPQKPRGGTSITITGQVPTPQVVTVRPREAPAFTKLVLVPRFYNRSFWPAVLPGYAVVPQRQITGGAALDSAGTPMTAGVPSGIARPGASGIAREAPPGAPPDSLDAARTRQQELESLQRELARRKERLDSLAARVRTIGIPPPARQPPDTTRRVRPDTTRKPPLGSRGSSRVR